MVVSKSVHFRTKQTGLVIGLKKYSQQVWRRFNANADLMRLRKEILFMKRYGYHRTNTREQHLDRGITEINAYCSTNNLELEKIFTDQQTGKAQAEIEKKGKRQKEGI